MKWNKLILISLITGSMLLMQSCEKFNTFGDINSNPNATTEPNTAALLTNVLSQIGNTVWGNGITIQAGLNCQYFSETQYTEASRYQLTAPNWGGYYAGPLYDLQNIINYNTSSPSKAENNGNNANQIAIARILKAYYFWIIGDTWGDLPYFDALKGTGAIKYDGLDKVYPDLIKELKEAVAQFVNPTISIKGDIMYNGDVSKWKKFANSLRLLIALRMSKKAAAAGQAAFNEALNDANGVFTTNSDNATITYPGGVFNHPLYNYYFITQRFDYALCKTLSDYLNANNDNRRSVYGTSTVGFPYGLSRDNAVAFANANTNWSHILSNSVSQPTSPMVIVGAANVYLARAEAARLGWTSESAATNYSLGIQRSWEQWGVYNASQFAAYMASPNIDLSTNPDQKIGTQSWVAWYPHGTQGWSTWRKTGYPALSPAPSNTPLLPIPRRLPYGSDEPNLNPTNYNTAAANYTVGGVANSQDAKIWWDQ
jgi:hypothetical protein